MDKEILPDLYAAYTDSCLRPQLERLDQRISDLIDLIRQGEPLWADELIVLLFDADAIRQELSDTWQRPPERQLKALIQWHKHMGGGEGSGRQ